MVQKLKKLVFFGYFSGYAVLAHKNALRDVQKSPRRVPKPSPRVPGPPWGDQKWTQNGPNGNSTVWRETSWGPRRPNRRPSHLQRPSGRHFVTPWAPFGGAFRHQNVLGNPKKK